MDEGLKDFGNASILSDLARLGNLSIWNSPLPTLPAPRPAHSREQTCVHCLNLKILRQQELFKSSPTCANPVAMIVMMTNISALYQSVANVES